MRISLCAAFAAGLALSAAAPAEDTIPLRAVNKAGEVIDAAIEAYGGAEALQNLRTVARKSTFTTWATNQSRKPGPPWDEGTQENFQAVDLEDRIYVTENSGVAGGFEFSTRQVIEGDKGWNISYRAGSVTTIPNPDFNTSSGPLIRITAPLLVKQLMQRRQTSHWLGETELNGRPHDIITLVMEVGPALSLYFDRETHLLSRSERVLPPFGQVDYRFSGYQEIGGIPFAKDFKLYLNDQPNLYIDFASTRINQPLDQYTALPADFEMVEGVAPATEVSVKEIAEGVFQAGSGTAYGMFVDMGDYVVAVGATAGVADRIRKLREAGVDKPIRYAVLTHHHNDHLAGVPDYEAEGATLFTVRENEAVVRANASNGDALKLQFVKDRYVFDSNGHRLEIYDIGPTPHVEHLLVAYLPATGVLFEADHFANPTAGSIPPAQPNTRRLAEAIDQLGLNVKTIIGAHSPRIASIGDLRASLALQPRVEITAAP